jgi:hypothetical protein
VISLDITFTFNEELQNLYSSPNIIRMIKSRRMIWAGHVARIREKRNAYRLLVEKPEEKRPLGGPRRRWMNNIKMGLRDIGRGGVDWIYLAQDRAQWRGSCENGNEPSDSIKFWEILE